MIDYPRKDVFSHVTSLNFCKISGNISETVQDKHTVAIEDK